MKKDCAYCLNAARGVGGWGRGEGDSHMKRTGCSLYLSGVVKAFLVALRVFSLKTSTAGTFEVPFRVLS